MSDDAHAGGAFRRLPVALFLGIPMNTPATFGFRRVAARPLGLAVACAALTLTALFPLGAAAQNRQSAAAPGTVPQWYRPADRAPDAPGPNILDPIINETGLIALSIDGCGTTFSSCIANVEKPAGATVREAWITASTSFNYVIADGEISINGNPVDFALQVSTDAGPGFPDFFSSHFANVTSIVKPVVDAGGAGLVPLTIAEGNNTFSIDGVGIVVVFDDPSQTTQSTVIIAFGGQATTGDTFALTLSEPFDDATQDVELSLAIGFSVNSGGQFSLIDVNGERMTSSAGDFDDGELANGALYTIGGVGDSEDNPADPNNSSSPDDELYTLDEFIGDGDTDITVFSSNPSNDDIIHLATFLIRGTAAIIGEGILLTPLDATNPVNTDHTVTARVQDDDGDPVSGRDVDFEVLSGPNAGLTGSDATDGAGEATFTFSSAVAGTDVVVARFTDSQGVVRTSNEATKTWTDGGGAISCVRATGLYISDYDTGGQPGGEFTRLTNAQDDLAGIDLGDCTFAVFDAFTELVTYSAGLNDTELTAADDYLLANDNVAGRDQTFPDNTLPDGPGAIAVLGLPAAAVPVGTDVLEVNQDVVAACVYYDEDNVFDCVPLLPDGEERARTQAEAYSRTGPVSLSDALRAVRAQASAAAVTALGTSRPNPVRGSAQVAFSLAEASEVRLTVYDALGREVARLVDGTTLAAGRHGVTLDARGLQAGVYVLRMEAGGTVATQRLVVVE